MKKINVILLVLLASFMFISTQGCADSVTPNDDSSEESVVSSSDEDDSSQVADNESSAEISTSSEDVVSSDIGESSSDVVESSDDVSVSSEDVSSSEVAESSADNVLVIPESITLGEFGDEITELLGKMSIEEKVGQMIQGSWFNSSDIEGDIAKYHMGSLLHASIPPGKGGAGPDKDAASWASTFEALQNKARNTGHGIPLLLGIDAVHGNAFLPGSTVFPHNIGLGASGDEDLVRRIGEATAKQVAATGMNLTFGPVANMSQHEWWGRMYESYGESSDMVTKLTRAIVYGLQGDDLAADNTIAACPKHFLGDGVTKNGHERGESIITDLTPHYAPYQAAVDLGVNCVMAGFTQVNGIRMHHHTEYLTYLKDDMGFDGIVISDWKGWEIGYTQEKNGISEETPLTIADAVNAGVDLLMAADDDPVPNGNPDWITAHHSQVYNGLLAAVEAGDIKMDRINDAVARNLRIKYRLGLFDKTDGGHHYQSTIGSQEFIDLAREAVQKTVTVLKNKDDILPLDETKKYVVVGEHANNTGLTSGGWTRYWQGNAGSGQGDNNQPGDAYKDNIYATDIWEPLDVGTTILDGVKEIVGDANVKFDESGSGSEDGDVAIVVIGEYPYAEWLGDEEVCKADMWTNICADGERTRANRLSFSDGMLGSQKDMVDAYVAKDMKVVVVVITGRPIPSDDIIADSDAFTVAWLPGSEGAGVADVLFGVAPATAKLPHAWISSLDGLPINGDESGAIYPFGHSVTYGAK